MLVFHCIPLCADVDTDLMSSAVVVLPVLPGVTEFETLVVLNPLDFTVSNVSAGQLVLQAPNLMATISDFETVLRSVAYSTTRALRYAINRLKMYSLLNCQKLMFPANIYVLQYSYILRPKNSANSCTKSFCG